MNDSDGQDRDRPLSDETTEGTPELPFSQTARCGHCGLHFAAQHHQNCPSCDTPSGLALPMGMIHDNGDDGLLLKRILIAFGILLITSVMFSFIEPLAMGRELLAEDYDLNTVKSLLQLISVAEVVDSIIVLIAVATIGRAVPLSSSGQRRLGWLLMIPLLAVGLGINIGYHEIIDSIVRMDDDGDALYRYPSLLPWLLIVICVQPAIIEELFFRHLCLGALRPIIGTGSAIFVSSMMFGIAHLHVLVSIPALILLGVVLGIARTVSGSLWVPIAIHFLHNLAVIYIHMFYE